MINRRGKNTIIVVRVDERIGPATSLLACKAAFFLDIPWAIIRYMFSITTIELSTNMPTPRARPPMDITLRVTPEKYISTKLVTRLIAMDAARIRVGLKWRRKDIRTRTAKRAPIKRLSKTVSIIIFT